MPLVSDIQEATADLPLLGYTVVASLKGVEIDHNELLALLTPIGFAHFLPSLVEPRTALRRAIRAWIKELAANKTSLFDEDEGEGTKKQLIREINTRKSQVLTLALVEENIDLEALGLSYLTNLRVFYDKKAKTVSLTTTDRGVTHAVTSQDRQLLSGLLPHYERYGQLHSAGDLSRMIQDIIASMNASTLRANGGIYFVPYDQRDNLARLKELIEEKLPPPKGGTNTSNLLHLPVVDTSNAKQQLAGAAHNAFLQELEALQKDLDRFIEQSQKGKVKRDSMVERLVKYQQAKKRVELYEQVLGMRREQVIEGLAHLEKQALALIQMPGEEESAQEEAPSSPAGTVSAKV